MMVALDLDIDVVELAPCARPRPSPLREMAFSSAAWLPAEDATMRALFVADQPIAKIAEAVGRTFHAVRARIDLLGLRRNSTRPWTDVEDLEVMDRYGSEPCAAIALSIGRSAAAVYARAHLLSLCEPAALDYDEWEDAQIRAGYASGVPVGQIATLIGRSLIGVRCRASALGVRHPSQPPTWTDDEATRALELAEEGHRYLSIIERLVDEGFPRRTKNGFGQRLRILGYGRGWGRRWLPEEDEMLRRAYSTGASLTPVRTRLGRSNCSIRWRAGELGLQGTHRHRDGFRQGPVWSAEEDAELRASYGKIPSKDLAERLGRKLSAVLQRAAQLGVKHGYIRMFTADERRAIGIAWRRGLSMTDLAQATARDVAVISKQAIRLGLSFSDPARPARGPRTPRARRQALSLVEILALEPPSAEVDGPIEETNRRNEERAARNRGAAAASRGGSVMIRDQGAAA